MEIITEVTFCYRNRSRQSKQRDITICVGASLIMYGWLTQQNTSPLFFLPPHPPPPPEYLTYLILSLSLKSVVENIFIKV